jgi:hypothetical protein
MKRFFCSFDPIYVKDLRSEIFLILVKNSPRWLNFTSLDILEGYGKILFAFSPYALKYFLHILRISLNAFRIFRDDFVYRKQP